MARSVKAVIRYDGPALTHHQMDVHELAPALLALGDLCRVANSALNGDMATVKVLVRADIEQQCFQLQFEILQTLYEHVTALLDHDRIKEAKDILEWIGIVGGGGATLFALIKFLAKKKPKDEIAISHNNAEGTVVYQIIGTGNSITVPKEVDQIARDPRSLHAVQRLVRPLEQEGYETLEFERASKSTLATVFTREEARQIVEMDAESLIIRREGEQISRIKTRVRVRKPVMEGGSMWGVAYKRAIDAQMIDQDWLEDYQAGRIFLPPKSWLVVDLEETVPIDEEGIEAGPATYKILKVHGVELPPEQYSLLFDPRK